MISGAVAYMRRRIFGQLLRRSAACRKFRSAWCSWLCLLVHSRSAVRAVIKRICWHKKRLFASTTDSSPVFDCFTVVSRDIFSCPVGSRWHVRPTVPFFRSFLICAIPRRYANPLCFYVACFARYKNDRFANAGDSRHPATKWAGL